MARRRWSESNTVFATQQEAARVLGVDVRTIQKWVADGRLPTVQWGKVRRIPKPVLEEYAQILAKRAYRERDKIGGEW